MFFFSLIILYYIILLVICMLIIGSHVSFNKNEQLVGSVQEAISYGSNAFMFYTGAPQNTVRVPLSLELKNKAHELMSANGIDVNNVIVHAPYIVNLANPVNFDFSVEFLKKEIERCEFLGIKKLVLHPGSHVGNGVDLGLNTIVNALNLVLYEETDIIICLEMMAGKGSELGTSFEQMKYIIDRVKYNDKLMICFDTCHMNDQGYDINNFDSILEEFDKVIGIEKLGCIHVNDSKNEKGMKKDRHDNFGFGTIGFNNLLNVVYNSRLEDIPKILETPWVKDEKDSYPPYKFEIEMIRNKEFDSDLINKIIKNYK